MKGGRSLALLSLTALAPGASAGGECGPGCDATLFQAPQRVNAEYSDASCTLCMYPQVLADDVVLAEPVEVREVVLWGGYLFANTPPAADDFTLVVHRDGDGAPGPVVRLEHGVATSRTATGLTIQPGTDQYRFVLTLAEPLPLAPGTYWFEIYNDTHDDDDDFGWERGHPDPEAGGPGRAVAFTAPGSGWIPGGEGDMAWVLCTRPPPPAPSLSGWGLVLLVGTLLGLGARGLVRSAPGSH